MNVKSPAELVNPYIGTMGHLLTSTRPAVMLPHGSAQIFPAVSPSRGDYFISDRIAFFPLGELPVMFAGEEASALADAESRYDVSAVEAHPYRISVFLEDWNVTVSASTTMRGFLYRVERAKKGFIRIGTRCAWNASDGALRLSVPGRVPSFLYVRLPEGAEIEEKDGELVFTNLPEVFELPAAVSRVSLDKAEEIFARELAGKSLDDVTSEAKAIWDDLLGRIRITGGSEDSRIAYYTALYRSFGKMTDCGEYGSYYSGFDGAVHEGEFWCNDQLWDSWRCMHPLQLLLEPEKHKKMLDSYVEMYHQSGAMPSFPYQHGDNACMLGFHAAALFADGLAKGIETDYATAFEGLYRSATETSMLPWVADKPAGELEQCYYEKGFYPALEDGQEEWIADAHSFERRQAVAVTLEHAYDDWCIAQLAKHLGKDAEYEAFMKRAQNYRNVYNREIGFMAPKNAAGEWLPNYDPLRGGGQGGRAYFAECNAYTFNFSVWHDPEGLSELMGGREGMAARLDELFTNPARTDKYDFLKQFPDSTGLMGMFCMGNEPSFHIPYLYDYCGKPWMAQRRLRTIAELWFTNSPLGICGDDDSGAMSSWLAFTGMGFYPVCPGKAEYALGTPLFDKIELTLGEKRFVIRAEGAGEGKRYIKSASLNGEPLRRPFLSHRDLVNGGELVLEMDGRANREWGI